MTSSEPNRTHGTSSEPNRTHGTSSEPNRTHGELRERRLREIAHRIWEEEGRPEGQDRRHWQMAKDIMVNQKIEGEDSFDDDEEPPLDEERRH